MNSRRFPQLHELEHALARLVRKVALDWAEGKKDGKPDAPASRPTSVLTKRGADALVRVEGLMDDATRALAIGGAPSKATGAQGASVRSGPIASGAER